MVFNLINDDDDELYKGRVQKKKWWNFPLKWGGCSASDFPLRKKHKKKFLKHWIMPIDHFKTQFFFLQFLGGETLFSSDPGSKGVSNL